MRKLQNKLLLRPAEMDEIFTKLYFQQCVPNLPATGPDLGIIVCFFMIFGIQRSKKFYLSHLVLIGVHLQISSYI